MNIEKIEKNGTICAVVRSDEVSSFNITTALLGCDVVFDEKTAGYGPAVLHNICFSAKAILT